MTLKELRELVGRLRKLHDKQRSERGDYLMLGTADPELLQAADALTALLARIEALEAENASATEWREQHENLLNVRQSDLAVVEQQSAEIHRFTEMLRRTLAYLPSTLRITQDIRAALASEERT